MAEKLMNRKMVISFVGLSGTGKSLNRRVLQHSLAIRGTSSGDLMRQHILHTHGVDLEQYVGKIVDDDDRMVDQASIEWMKKSGARTIDGRTQGAFLAKMERDGEIESGSSLRVAIKCEPETVRASRALRKFRNKPGLEHIGVNGVVELQRVRDETDLDRYIRIWGDLYDFDCADGLYGLPPNQLEINTAIVSPSSALVMVLANLVLLDALPISNLPIAYIRGESAINRFMK